MKKKGVVMITRKWLEEQLSLTWTDDVQEWYKNCNDIINNILNKLSSSTSEVTEFKVGDVVDWVNSKMPTEEFCRGTIIDIDPIPAYHVKGDDGREWIHVKQHELTMVKKPKPKLTDLVDKDLGDVRKNPDIDDVICPNQDCQHPLIEHGELGCNVDHWLENGCKCTVTV
jgi:hypothetical protein